MGRASRAAAKPAGMAPMVRPAERATQAAALAARPFCSGRVGSYAKVEKVV